MGFIIIILSVLPTGLSSLFLTNSEINFNIFFRRGCRTIFFSFLHLYVWQNQKKISPIDIKRRSAISIVQRCEIIFISIGVLCFLFSRLFFSPLLSFFSSFFFLSFPSSFSPSFFSLFYLFTSIKYFSRVSLFTRLSCSRLKM